MNARDIKSFRSHLLKLAKRIEATASSAEEQARTATGGDQSNAPLHLADIGSDEYAQELGATLLENEQYLQGEILAALSRIEHEKFGRCESCGCDIARERLKAIPYARYCLICAETEQNAPMVNLNEGRPRNWQAGIGIREDTRPSAGSVNSHGDIHAAGTPGGGTAIGGLAGTNTGDGTPDDDLEEAMGSGNFDVETDSPEEEAEGFSGISGGAVGGTPANKRASGGTRPKG